MKKALAIAMLLLSVCLVSGCGGPTQHQEEEQHTFAAESR